VLKVLFFVVFLQSICFAQVSNYALEKNWAALPTIENASFWVPKNADLKNNQKEAEVDVFFIHPTTDIYGFKASGNTNIDNKKVNIKTDELSIKYQASVFNGTCKVYAPRYRQAVLHNFFSKNSDKSKAAFNLAYSDIKAAFEYYLANYNHGRPIIIAGHSQGTMHAARLLKEFFDGKPLQKQLVVAYLIGYPIYASEFQFIKVADDADSLGGFVSYNTFLMGADNFFTEEYKNAVVVNPLSWKTDKQFVDASKHLGGIKTNKEQIFPNLFGALCGNGILEVQKPNVSGYVPLVKNNYHLHDYSLFYMNLRENIAHRANLYINLKKL